MNDFEKVPLTVSQIKMMQDQERKERQDFFYQVGYNSIGCYIITFPNGKKYIGKSDRLGYRIKQHLSQLIPIGRPPRTYSSLWYEQAVKENKGMMKSFRDVDIQVIYNLNPNKETSLLQAVPLEERSNYYNTQWNDL